VNIAKQKEKAKPAANLAFMMVPPVELFPEHLPFQTEVQIVTKQRECPAMRFLNDGLPLTLTKKEREDSLDLPFRSQGIRLARLKLSAIHYWAAGALLADVAAPGDFGVER
jgi:hypothetical protein